MAIALRALPAYLFEDRIGVEEEAVAKLSHYGLDVDAQYADEFLEIQLGIETELATNVGCGRLDKAYYD